jgi:hypothetical protein
VGVGADAAGSDHAVGLAVRAVLAPVLGFEAEPPANKDPRNSKPAAAPPACICLLISSVPAWVRASSAFFWSYLFSRSVAET